MQVRLQHWQNGLITLVGPVNASGVQEYFYYRRAKSHDEDVTVPARSVALMVTCKQ